MEGKRDSHAHEAEPIGRAAARVVGKIERHLDNAFWEIQDCIFAVDFARGVVVSTGGIFRRLVFPKPQPFLIVHYPRDPMPVEFTYSTKTGLTDRHSPVLCILAAGANAQIVFAIIKGVSVNVINNAAYWCTQYQPSQGCIFARVAAFGGQYLLVTVYSPCYFKSIFVQNMQVFLVQKDNVPSGEHSATIRSGFDAHHLPPAISLPISAPSGICRASHAMMMRVVVIGQDSPCEAGAVTLALEVAGDSI